MEENTALLQSAQKGKKRSIEMVAAQMPTAPSPFWTTAWNNLNTMRAPAQGGIAPIPIRAIKDYADDLCLDPLMEDLFCYVIRAVDDHFTTKINGKLAKQINKP